MSSRTSHLLMAPRPLYYQNGSIRMANFTCDETFENVEAAESVWLYVISKDATVESPRTQRIWTDRAKHTIQLTDLSDRPEAEHALIAFRRRHPPLWAQFTRPTNGENTTVMNLPFADEI